MNNKYIYELIDEILSKSSKEQIRNFLFRIIDEFGSENHKEMVKLINETFKDEIQTSNLKDLDKKIEKIEEQFALINNDELQFHCEIYETGNYDYWGDGYETSYYDPENIGNIVVDAYNLATILVNMKDYKNAKKIFDLIIFSTYSVLDDTCDDILDYGIDDIVEYDLVDIDLNKMCLTVLYITLLISDNKCNDIYKYYDTHIFDSIKVEDCFQIATNNINNFDTFWENWIKYLSKKDDEIAYKLLTDALEYKNYEDYREILKLNTKTHPELYLFIFEYLIKLNKYEEIIEIGNSVLNDMNDDIKNEMSLLIATSYKKLNSSYDISDYLYNAFLSSHSISNLIRIINNDYLEKYKNKIELIKEDPYKNANDFVIMRYFLGEFDTFFSFFSDNNKYIGWTYSRMTTYVELMVFLLCNECETDIKKILADSICFDIGIKDNYNLYNSDEQEADCLKILNTWKRHFTISNDIKETYIIWLEEKISKRVDTILSNQHRGSYDKAAFLVCILDECLENLNIKNKGEVIDFYEKKYYRFIAFKKEINKFKNK